MITFIIFNIINVIIKKFEKKTWADKFNTIKLIDIIKFKINIITIKKTT
jgi:hypothetical protein